MPAASGHAGVDLRDLLAFYADSGADASVGDAPVDRFAEGRRPRPTRPQGDPATDTPDKPGGGPALPGQRPSPLPAAAATVTVPDGAQAARARELARSAGSLEELRAILADFDGCNLRLTAKQLVFADGNPQAPVMFVGEAPGRDEDLEGLPFVGRSGQLLDRMLAAIGLDRRAAYIANVIPWRPPGNRTPTPHETEICRPFIERQIELAGPKVLVTLGGPSAKVILGVQEGIMRLRGSWREHRTASGIVVPTMPTLHPAYLLRNPAHKKFAWRDFLEIKARLRSCGALP